MDTCTYLIQNDHFVIIQKHIHINEYLEIVHSLSLKILVAHFDSPKRETEIR